MNKICNCCGEIKSLDCFEKQKISSGKIYYRNKCKTCKNKNDYNNIKNDINKWNKKLYRHSQYRWDPKKRTQFILSDSKQCDKNNGLENDLDKDFIEKIILNGCSYCGNVNIRIGLDRINNKIGHMKFNVVSACTRCNFIRRDMPYDAWKLLVPAIKKATEEGLFGDWTGGFNLHKKRKNENE